jgi:hypothetical protein
MDCGSFEARTNIGSSLVAASDVNTLPSQHVETDALAACRAADPKSQIGGVETSTALIRAKTNMPSFMFISEIADESGYYSREVRPRVESFCASHNMGVVLGWPLAVARS